MGAKTIALIHEAYEDLVRERRDGESISDVVRRLTGGVTLAEYHGVLDVETADELEAIVEDRRRDCPEAYRHRDEEFDDDSEWSSSRR